MRCFGGDGIVTTAGIAGAADLLRLPDGRYVVGPGADREPGTTVTLLPRRGAEHWLTGPTVTGLARLYGSLLPVAVTVDGDDVLIDANVKLEVN